MFALCCIYQLNMCLSVCRFPILINLSISSFFKHLAYHVKNSDSLGIVGQKYYDSRRIRGMDVKMYLF